MVQGKVIRLPLVYGWAVSAIRRRDRRQTDARRVHTRHKNRSATENRPTLKIRPNRKTTSESRIKSDRRGHDHQNDVSFVNFATRPLWLDIFSYSSPPRNETFGLTEKACLLGSVLTKNHRPQGTFQIHAASSKDQMCQTPACIMNQPRQTNSNSIQR